MTVLSPQNVITTDDVFVSSSARHEGPAAAEVGASPRAGNIQQGVLEAAIFRLGIRLFECRRTDQAGRIAATALVELLGGGRLAVGVMRQAGKSCRLCALSSVPQIDRRSERSQALEAALDEVLLAGGATAFGAADPAEGPQGRLPLKAHERVARATGSRAVVGIPLKSGHRRAGALLWCDEGRPLDAAAAGKLLKSFGDVLGPILETIGRAERSAAGRLRDRFGEMAGGNRKRAIRIGTALFLCFMLLPLPYRPACDAQLEPTARRYVVAPFESALEKTLVQPGDVVQQNDVVASLDGRDLLFSLAQVKSDLDQAETRYDRALAANKNAEARLARLEAEGLRFKRDQLIGRQDKLQIKTPVSGMVLSGELERAEGAALTTGQTLLEIAPLDELLVEIAVPEHKLRVLEPGRSVSLKLNAFPGKRWSGTVQRVRPVAEIRDSNNVFIAEVRLENSNGALRPGMKGRAKITGPLRPLAWIVFHRPYEALRQWLGW